MQSKKIGLITYHKSYNYGASLQAYATVKLFEKYQFETVVIDYCTNNFKGFGTIRNTVTETALCDKNIIVKYLYAFVKTPSYRRQIKVFNDFVSKSLPVSRTYYSSEELKEDLPEVDYFCTGSDQVWNNHWSHVFEGAFFLDFVPDGVKCFSLASSFGKDSFIQEELDYIKQHLEKYDYISVREKEGINLLKSVGYNEAHLMLDPTLLVSCDVWKELAVKPDIDYPYILVYQLHGDSDAYDKAVEFGKKHGIKVVRIVTMYHQMKRGCKNVITPSVNEFVGLFEDAEYVFTDSFHGTIFSMLNQKKLGIRLPHKFSNRITTLLQLLNAEEFIINDMDSWENALQGIDYIKITEMLHELQESKLHELEEYFAEL